MSKLPNKIIHYDVLTRLPAKSLLRFKSVCKDWYALIKSRTFINIHQNYAIESHDYSSDDLLIVGCGSNTYCKTPNKLFFIYLYAPFSLRGTHVICDDKVNTGLSRFIVGSCNGVICIEILSSTDTFALYNLLTRECRKLVKPRCDHYSKYPSIYTTYGFGYDSISRDYKIIRTFLFKDRYNMMTLGGIVHVYSSRTNSWKDSDKINPFINQIIPGYIVVNNVLHCICSMKDNGDYFYIFTFNLHTEKSGCIALPKKYMEDGDDQPSLMVSNGRLYTIVKNLASFQASIWVMKQYGMTKSWTKLYEFGGEVVQFKIITYRSSKRSGEMLIVKTVDEQNDELMWYNFEHKSFRKVDLPQKNKYDGNQLVCISSLAPILGD
ncbi:hypothetical protein RND81_13G004800 [Saponaria officinalis]|uniref:F-box domain-containing protein n=1 Tax=Saponaria officinalis TaxID=3572 RepID=A0AAW1GSC0_SAPOF